MSSSDQNALGKTLYDAELVRLKLCRYGVMAYFPHDQYIGRSLDLYGEFSPGEADFFSQVLKPGMVAVDVGANAGAHSVLFARKVGPTGLVLAFEPQRPIYQLLCTNLTMNGLLHARPIHAASGSISGSIQVPPLDYSKEANFGSLSLGNWNVGESVPVLPIDSFNLPACHLIKADVEGMEAEVLRGAAKTIEKYKPVLYVENDRAEKAKELIELMRSMEYRLYDHRSPYFSPQNHFQNSENVFGNTYSFNVIGIHRSQAVIMQGIEEI